MYRPIYCTYPGGHIMCNNQSCQASLALAHSITLVCYGDDDDDDKEEDDVGVNNTQIDSIQYLNFAKK